MNRKTFLATCAFAIFAAVVLTLRLWAGLTDKAEVKANATFKDDARIYGNIVLTNCTPATTNRVAGRDIPADGVKLDGLFGSAGTTNADPVFAGAPSTGTHAVTLSNLNARLTAKANGAHVHNAADIASGVLAAERFPNVLTDRSADLLGGVPGSQFARLAVSNVFLHPQFAQGGVSYAPPGGDIAMFVGSQPQWWTARQVINPAAPSNDFALANVAQLKWMATNAFAEFQAALPNGAGTSVSNLVAGFSTSNNNVSLNVGQLKYVASPYYDRIAQLTNGYPSLTNAFPTGVTGQYPWTTTTADDHDFQFANVGQLKHVFGFVFDRDMDGLPDWWELKWWSNLANQTGVSDADSDGLSNLVEYRRQTSPTNPINNTSTLRWDCLGDGNWSQLPSRWRTPPPNYPGVTENAVVYTNMVVVDGYRDVNSLEVGRGGNVRIGPSWRLSSYSVLVSNGVVSGYSGGYITSENTNVANGKFAYEMFAGTNTASLQGANAALRKWGTGFAMLAGRNVYTGRTQLDAGILRADHGIGLPFGSLLYFNGGMLLATGTIARTTGTLPGYVYWNANGGFSAFDAPLAIHLNGGSRLDWENATNGFNGKTLVFGCAMASNIVHLINDVDLRGNRTVQVDDNTATIADSARLSGALNNGDATARSFTKTGTGLLELTGTNTFSGGLILSAGVTRAIDGVGLPTNSVLQLNGGILESSGSVARAVGTGVGRVYWNNNGGFSAFGAPLTVTLNAGADIDWGVTNGFNGRTLIFGSLTADDAVELRNPVLLKANRTIQVNDNTNAATDLVCFTGNVVDGDATPRSLTKTGVGLLELAGTNTFGGGLILSAGTVRAVDGVGSPTSSVLQLNGGVFESSGAFARSIGNSAGRVYWNNNGGFSAFGAPLTVTLNAGADIHWGVTNGFNAKTLILGSSTANDVVDLRNPISLKANRTVQVDNNPFSAGDVARLSGAIANGDATARSLTKVGSGVLELTGTNTFSGGMTVNAGELRVNGNLVNSAATVSGAGTRLSGIGSVKGFTINAGAVLAPGNGGVGPGTLRSATNATLAAGSVYEWDIGPTNYDGVTVTGNVTLTSTWTLRLRDVGGFAAPSTRFILFKYTGAATVGTYAFDFTALTNAAGVPWGTNGVAVGNDTSNKCVYLTGLTQYGTADDTDSDGLPDGWEMAYFGNLTAVTGTGDSDNDGLTNLQEYQFDLNPTNGDMDNDGRGDGVEVLYGTSPTTSNDFRRLPFVESFEPTNIVVGALHGQRGWAASHVDLAIVEDWSALDGIQAVELNGADGTAGIWRDVGARGTNVVWEDYWAKPSRADASAWDWNAVSNAAGGHLPAANFHVTTNLELRVYDGTSDEWSAIRCEGLADEWVRFTVEHDLSARTWSIWVQGVLTGTNLGFMAGAPTEYGRFTHVALTGTVAYLDFVNLCGSTNGLFRPLYSTDTDGDGMPDTWETANGFNPTNAADGVQDADGDGICNLFEFCRDLNPRNGTNVTTLTWDGAGNGYWAGIPSRWLGRPPNFPGATENANVRTSGNRVTVDGARQVNILQVYSNATVEIANHRSLSANRVLVSNAFLTATGNGYVTSGNTNRTPGNFAYEMYSGTNTAILNGANASLRKFGTGLFFLQGQNAYSGRTQIDAGILVANDGQGLSSASQLYLNGGILGSAGLIGRTVSANSDGLLWNNTGGFAAHGGNLAVRLNDGNVLDWANATNGLNGKTLLLSSTAANGAVELQNPMNLKGARTVQVDDNTTSWMDFARMSGTIANGDATPRGLTKSGSGWLELSGTNTFSGGLTLGGGYLRAQDGIGIPAGGLLQFNTGILESSGAFTRASGNAAGKVYWANNGGFAAVGAPLDVTLDGGATLNWTAASTGFNARTLTMGSGYADNTVTVYNPIQLRGDRTIQVNDNTNTVADVARFAGVIGNGDTTNRALYKTGTGVLELTATNTYGGVTYLNAGVLRGVNGVGLPTNSLLQLNTGVLESRGTFARASGNTAGRVYWYGNGGFAAQGGSLTVTLDGGSLLNWGTITNGFNAKTLILSSASADSVVTLSNPIGLYANRTVQVDDNPFSTNDFARLSGAITNGDATARSLTKTGLGLLELTGTNTFSGGMTVSAGELRLNGCLVNSAVSVSGAGTRLSGIGSVKGFTMNAGAILAPGNGGGNTVGTLVSATNVTIASGGIYEWELGSATNDSVTVTGNVTLTSTWVLRLKDAGGVSASSSNQYTLFKYTGTATVGGYTVETNFLSGTNVYLATNGLAVVNDAVGKRVYLTGLVYFGSTADMDIDGLPDWWEMKWFGHLLCSGTDDNDFDYVSNADEYLRGLSPVAEDSDGDGLSDGPEIYTYGTNPGNPDTDGDGIDDGWEASHGLNPLASDAEQDADFDGLPSLQEYMIGTHPNNYDTDGDGLDDGQEVGLGSDPLDTDTDHDKLTDWYEVYTSGTNPLDPDSDDDGTTDGAEYLDCPQSGPIGPDPGHPHVVTFDCDAAEIQPPGLPNDAKFGYAVAVTEDDFAVIGSPGENRAYFYHGSPNVCGARDPGEWTLQGITSDDGLASLGSAVAICRNDWGVHIAAIGAPESQMVMLYIEHDGIWTSPLGWGEVVPSFGQALAMTSARIVVGAPYADPTYGQVYIYDIGGNLEQVLTGAPGFGSSLDIDHEYGSDLIVVGNPVAGTVVPYRLRNGTWQADMDLPFPPIPSFGTSVAIVGFMDGDLGLYRNRIYVGMPDFGEVHMFGSVNLDPFWMPEGVVSGSTLDSALGFGSVLAKRDSPLWDGEGDVKSIFVGATDLIAPGKGDVPLLTESAVAVGGAKRLVNPAPEENSSFGCAIGSSTYRVLAGARNVGGKGAVYAYSLRGWFLGDMNDQFYWKSTVARTCMVQTNVVFSGDAALEILPSDVPVSLYRDTWWLEGPPGAAYPAEIWSQWIDYHTIPARCAADDRPTLDPQCPVGLCFDDAGRPMVYTRFFDYELGYERQDWVVSGNPVPAGKWARVTIHINYIGACWELWLNGVPIAGLEFPSFFSPEPGWSEFERRWCFYGSKRASTYIDQLSISLDEPPGFRDDFNGNGLPDSWEAATGLIALESGAGEDPDKDGLINRKEWELGTNPLNVDTDGDGMPDGWENANGLSPLIPTGDNGPFGDPDNDALSNGDEYSVGTDPHNANSTGDGLDSTVIAGKLGLKGVSFEMTSACGVRYVVSTRSGVDTDVTYGHLSDMRECEAIVASNGTDAVQYKNGFGLGYTHSQDNYTTLSRETNVLKWTLDTSNHDVVEPVENLVDQTLAGTIKLFRGRWTHNTDYVGTPQSSSGSDSSEFMKTDLVEGSDILGWTFRGFFLPGPESNTKCGGWAKGYAKWTHKIGKIRIAPRDKFVGVASADISYTLENSTMCPVYEGTIKWTIVPLTPNGPRFVVGAGLGDSVETTGGVPTPPVVVKPGSSPGEYVLKAESCDFSGMSDEVGLTIVSFGLNPAITGFWANAGASVRIAVTGVVPSGVTWQISAPPGISVSTTCKSATLTATGSGSGVINLTATAIDAVNEGSGLVQGGEPSGSSITATAWALAVLGENTSPTLICTKGIHPRHAVSVDRACYLHLWGSYPWHAVFDAGDPRWGFNDHTTSGPEVMFLRGLETGCFVEDEESLEFTFPPLTDPTLINFFTVLDLNTFTATVCDQNAIANQYQHGGRLRIARNVDPLDLQLVTMPQLYVFTDDLLLWEFARDDKQLVFGAFPRTAPRTTSFAVHPETFEPGANYTLNAWFDCDNENDKAGVRASDESTLHIHVSVMDLDIWATDASGYSPDPNEAVDGWMQEWAILGQIPGYTALHIADPGVYEGILCVSWPNTSDASMNVLDCSVPYDISEVEGTTTLMFDLTDMSSMDFPIYISVVGQIDSCETIPVTLGNTLYCGEDTISLVPNRFTLRARATARTPIKFVKDELELCIPLDWPNPVMEFKVDIYGDALTGSDICWDIVPIGSAGGTWNPQSGDFSVNPLSSSYTGGPGEYYLRAWSNCEGGGPGYDEGELLRQVKIVVANLEVTLHPNDGDFVAGKEGRVMISAALDHKYYTTKKTTIGESVAQVEDGKVKITAHLTPATALEGKLVFFRLVDPDPPDLSSYYAPGRPPGDNDAPAPNKAGRLSLQNKAALVTWIDGRRVAAAEVELTITDRYAGDNYRVECSLDGGATVAASTSTLVAWKRVYYKCHRMWAKGSDLVKNFTATVGTDTSDIFVADPSIFAVNSIVKVFDGDSRNGEDVEVLAKSGNKLTVEHLTKSYSRGYRYSQDPSQVFPSGRGAAVAIPTEGILKAPAIWSYLTKAYGGDTAGTDGGCFIEFTDVGDGLVLPYREYWTEPNGFDRYWFETIDSWDIPHLINITSAYRNSAADPECPGTAGGTHSLQLFCGVLCDTTRFPSEADRKTISAKISCHEIGEVLNNGGNCSHSAAHDNIARCLMNCTTLENLALDNDAEFHLQHINAVRQGNDDF